MIDSWVHRALVRIALAFLSALIAISLSACSGWVSSGSAGSGYHVSLDGSDEADGSIESPWRTIQYATDRLRPGETLFIHAGVYYEQVTIQVSGNDISGAITIAALPGTRPILDGSRLSGDGAMLRVSDQSHLAVQGLEIRGHRASVVEDFPVGILIEGACEAITIRDCVLHDIGNNLPPSNGSGPFANGIGIYGTREQASRDINLIGNGLYDIEVGGSEVVVVNGNVSGFEISGNHIHQVNNIAIDCIGFEGTAPSFAVDQARNGIIRGNRIEDTSGAGNAYYDDDFGALGVYVDGARNILIDGNTILRTDFGVEISSEHAGRFASRITVINNVIAESRTAGLSVGGWEEDWGGARDVTIVNNTLYHNNVLQDGHGEIALVRHIHGIHLANNILIANEDAAFILNEASTGAQITSNHNLFVAPDGSADGFWIWNGSEYNTFSQYRAASGNDEGSIVADPHLANPAHGAFSLRPGSPAVDTGSHAVLPSGIKTDHQGSARILDGDGDGEARVDIGALELVP